MLFTGQVAMLAQNTTSNIGTRFQSHATKNIQEKIYVHLNRPDLLTGEILWFKIYCVDAMQHRPLDLSLIAYAEIIDQNNKPWFKPKLV